jgi:hypothetical protein
MANDREASLTLFAKVDDATIQRSIKRFRELAAAEKDVKKASDWAFEGTKRQTQGLPPLNAELQKKIANLRTEMWESEKRWAVREKEIKALEKEAEVRKKVTEAAKKQEEAVSGASSASTKGSEKQLSELAGGIGSSLAPMAGSGPAGDMLRAASSISRLKKELEQFASSIDTSLLGGGKLSAASSAVTSFGGSLATLAVSGGLAIAAFAAIAIAINKFVEDLRRQQELLTAAVDSRIKYYELIQTATADEIQAEIERIEVRKNAIEWTIKDTQAGIENAKALGGLEGALASLLEMIGIFNKETKEREEELKKLEIELDNYRAALNSNEVQQRTSEKSTQELTSATKDLTSATNSQARAAEEAKRKEEERARAIKQAAQDIEQARMREAQAEAKASKKRIEKMEDIARRFAQSSSDALRKLGQDEEELAVKFGQKQVDIMLESQRDEEQAARDHVRSLKSIRDRASLDEFDAIRNRDFASLVEIRRNTEQQIDEKAEQFAAERKEANIALAQRLKDAAVGYQRERAARLTDYNNQLVELRINRSRQQSEARLAYRREIADLRRALQDEIALKQQALNATLGMTRSWANKMTSVLVRRSSDKSVGGTATGLSFATRATGGPLSAGQSSIVNEFGTERWMSAGRSMRLPDGAGIFTPFHGGAVQPAGGSPTVNMTVYASPGMDEERVAQIAVNKIHQKFRELVS